MSQRIHIDWRTLAKAAEPTIRNLLRRYQVDEDGLIWNVENPTYIFSPRPEDIGYTAGHCAIFHEATGDPLARDLAKACLVYARRTCARHGGVYFWPTEVPNLCMQGRVLKQLYRAAQILHDRATLRFIGRWLRAWPAVPEEHRLVERLVPGLLRQGRPVEHNRGSSQPYNMELEGAGIAWLIGHELGDEVLMERGRDTVLNYFLPGQRPDGLWDYAPGRGAEEVGYCLYALYLAAALLPFPEWRDTLAPPLDRALQEIERRSLLPDGAVYAHFHWGWDHIWETTVFYAHVAWMLQKYGGYDRSNRIARALHWFLECRLGDDWTARRWMLSGRMALFDLIRERVDVEGEASSMAQKVETLRRVEAETRAPTDEAHVEYHYSATIQIHADLVALLKRIEEQSVQG
jgi:hypothetical protein